MSNNQNDVSRFQGLPWFPIEEETIIIGGVGGIGSMVNLALSRCLTNTEVILYDMDHFEPQNTGGQFVTMLQASRRQGKTSAAIENALTFSGYDNYDVYEEYTQESDATPIMFSCFDNMEARRIMFNNWKKQEDRELFIDGRMTATMWQVFGVTKATEEKYEKEWLFTDEESSQLPCSTQQSTHVAMSIANPMISIFTNHIANKKLKTPIFRIPFLIENHSNSFQYVVKYK